MTRPSSTPTTRVCGRGWTEHRSDWCRAPSFLAQAALTSPALLPILSAYPLGTSPTSNPNVWNYVAPGRQVDNEDSGMIRVDQHFSDRTTAFLRFNSDEAVEQTPTGQLTAKTGIDTKFNNGVAELMHVFTPTLVNEVKFGVNQTLYHTANLSPVPFGVSVSGFSSLTGVVHNRLPVQELRPDRRPGLVERQTHAEVRI